MRALALITVALVLAACGAAEEDTSAPSEVAEPGGLPIGAGAPAPGGPPDACAVPFRFDERGRPVAVPAECHLLEAERGDPPPGYRRDATRREPPADVGAPAHER